MRLHLHEWGAPDAPPVVCLHGVTGHGRRFRKLAEERLARGFRVLAPDLRGHGQSGWEPPWTIETHLADLRETLEAAGAERPAWVGHSFGGRLIVELEPAEIERAVLLDPVIQLSAAVALGRAEAERSEHDFGNPEEALQARLDSGMLLHPAIDLLREEINEHLVPCPDGRLRYRYCQSAVVTLFGEFAKDPPPFERKGIRALLVVGHDVSFVQPQQLEDYRESCEVAAVPGGHLVLWDAFEETADEIERFLAA